MAYFISHSLLSTTGLPPQILSLYWTKGALAFVCFSFFFSYFCGYVC